MINDPIRVSSRPAHSHIPEYYFDPQPDITVWELAKCVALLENIGLDGRGAENKMREWGITRHFIRLTA